MEADEEEEAGESYDLVAMEAVKEEEAGAKATIHPL